jgi:putative ABC transport system permease protein
MNIAQSILEAFDSLSANKTRSALTILGIIIGVAAVIAMLAVGSGAQNTITGSISGIGSNLLFVFGGNMSEDVRNPRPLTLGDAQALGDKLQAPSVFAVAPVIQGPAEVTYERERKSSTVQGVTPIYQSVRNVALLEGNFFTDDQILERASVVVIGVEVADRLFGYREGLLGLTIRINGQPFRVVGVQAPKGGSAFGSEDNVVLMPFSTAQTRLIRRSNQEVDLIYVQATSPETVNSASDEIGEILRQRHRTEIGLDDFTIFSQQDFVATAQTITGVLTTFVGGVAAISLLVGGIGIMNIMLVSVTERTREIGLRKAVGARRRDILIQFLTESALLSLIGGVAGIILGWLIAYVIGLVAQANGTDLTPAVSLQAVLLATIFSTAVGLFFGLYPANRASLLEPVDALRYE